VTPGLPLYPELSDLASGSKITTYIASNSLDWTVRPTLLNNFTFGIQSSHEDFNQETSIYQWRSYGNRRINFASSGEFVGDLTGFRSPFD
jgi:hypothetical protein